MATVLVAAIGAYIGNVAVAGGASSLTIGLIAAATAAAAVGAAYLDSRYIYPKLFGTDEPRNPNQVAGIDQMTGDDGSPGNNAWGRAALVGGHVLWFENFEEIANRLTSKKGGGATMTKRLADVGVAWTHGRITSVERIFADQKPFWDRDPNQGFWIDYRVNMIVTGPNLALVAQLDEVPDFDPLFEVANVVKMTGALSTSGGPDGLDGYWRVVSVSGAAVGSVFATIVLSPLSGQTVATGQPGTPESPLKLQRIDLGVVDHLLNYISVQGNSINLRVGYLGPNAQSATKYSRDIRPVFKAGLRVRFENWTPIAINGSYEITQVLGNLPGGGIIVNFARVGGGNAIAPSPTSSPANNPYRIMIEEPFGFYEFSEGQELTTYFGTETEGPDPDLAAIYGSVNTHGYRGISRSTIRNYNLSNFGDRVGAMASVVRISDSHSTHDPIRELVAEAYGGDYSRVDLSALPPQSLLGFARRGQQPTSSVLQPLAIAYGIESQEVGRQHRFFSPQTADVVQLGRADFGAFRDQSESRRPPFSHTRIPDRDLPRILSLFYRDPVYDYARREQIARAEIPTSATSDQTVLDVDPVCLWPWDAQNAVRRLYSQSLVARDQGEINLPPSRCYVLPNDRVTFSALDLQDEVCTLVAGEVDHVAALLPIYAGTATIEIEWEQAGNCRLVEFGAGVWVGFPAGVTVTSNSVNYTTGAIEIAASDDTVVAARLRYRFDNPWRMRVQRVVRRTNRITTAELVQVAERFTKIGSPVQFTAPAYQPTIRVGTLRFEVLDVPAITPELYEGDAQGVLWVACPLPGSDWNGAAAYTSVDGTNWTARGVITTPTPIGTATTALAAGNPATWDWANTVTVQMDYGEPETHTPEQIDQGAGVGLLGSEILAWREAVANEDGTFTLRGLLRGMRNTEAAMAGHAIGDRFVILQGAGAPSGTPNASGLWDDWRTLPGHPLLGLSRWFRAAPVGAVVATTDQAKQLTLRGASRRPWSVVAVQQGPIGTRGVEFDPQARGYSAAEWLTTDVCVRWWRRHRGSWSIESPYPLWEPYERYRVTVRRNGNVVLQTHVGSPQVGALFVVPTFRLTVSEQSTLGFVSGNTAQIDIEHAGQFEYSPATSISWTIP